MHEYFKDYKTTSTSYSLLLTQTPLFFHENTGHNTHLKQKKMNTLVARNYNMTLYTNDVKDYPTV